MTEEVKIKIGIVGGAGYTGGELIRVLLFHPNAEIVYVQSNSQEGLLVSDVHRDLLGNTELKFTNELRSDVDVVFLCAGHGQAKKLVPQFSEGIKIIDLSQDFRLASENQRPFIYGLPEYNFDAIKTAQNIANPGCFATSIQLALLPLAKNNLLYGDIHIHATTGSTGAGKSLSDTTHFSWRENNLSVYKAFDHQHLGEIAQTLQALQPDYDGTLVFVPQRGAFPRGILSNVVLNVDQDLSEIVAIYEDFYKDAPFTHVSKSPIDLKQVVNTNKCIIHLEKKAQHLLITSVVDNLLKGASGQAVQNMNIMYGLDQRTGLNLKASAF